MRIFIGLIAGIIIGLVSHDFVSPYIAAITAQVVPDVSTEKKGEANPLYVDVVYENGVFTPDSVNIKVNSYLRIANNSQSPMWLTSDNPALTTVRGYAQGERLRWRAAGPGTYHVGNKLNVNARITVNVVK